MSGMQIRAFRPLGTNKTISIAVTATAQTLILPDVPFGTRSFRLVNSGNQTVFIDFYNTVLPGVATTGNSIPLLPNTIEVFTVGNDIGSISIVAMATGSTMYFTYGEGL